MRKILQKYFIKRTSVILNRHCGKYHNDFKYLRFLYLNIQRLTPTLVLQIKACDYSTSVPQLELLVLSVCTPRVQTL